MDVLDRHSTVTLYDERDLVRRAIRGANDTTQSTTTRYLYDENANLTHVYDDDLDVDGSDTPAVTTYDLFDRQVLMTDELGNEAETFYDKGSFVRRTIFRGPATHGGGAEVLAQSFMEYDEAGRLFQADHDHFDAIGDTALAGGVLTPPVDNSGAARGNLVSSVTVYDADGRTVVSKDARGNATAYAYDGAGRLVATEDARGNATQVVHDADGQTIAVLEGEAADVGAGATFVSRTFYDELGRPIVRVSPLGNSVRSLYDSRGLVRQVADAQADNYGWASALDTYSEHLFGGSYPDVQISGAGRRTRHAYDGAGRLVATERDLTSDGSGDSSVIGTITTLREYDRSSRLVGQLDDNGNRTTYVYDAQSRRVVVRNADNTQKLYLYDRVGNLRYTKDERNVVVTRDVDKLGRVTATTVEQIAFGPGQITYEAFQYDGLSRMLRGENNHAYVELRYDSLGPVIRETQTVNVGADRASSGAAWSSTVTAAVNSSYDANGNRTQLAYPGGTTINETYDVIDRRKLVKDGTTTIAEYMYVGPGYRVLEKRLPLAGTTLFRAYDGDRRVTRHDQRRTSDNQRLAGYTYAWDRVGNRWYERTLTNNTNPTETAGGGEAFRYDSAYRMRDNFEGVTSGSLDGLSSNTPRHTGSLTYDTVRSYALDGVGNRAEVTANGIVESAYLLAGDDFKTNQYSFVDDAPQRYDLAGNLLIDGTWAFHYDFRNQLIGATNGTTDARYRHDVLGRRVSKRTASGNFPGLAYGHAVYIQSGPEILEERDTSGNVRKEWVYGIRIDEPIRQRAPDYADLDNDTNTTELVDLYYLSNSLGSVTALVTTSGTVAER